MRQITILISISLLFVIASSELCLLNRSCDYTLIADTSTQTKSIFHHDTKPVAPSILIFKKGQLVVLTAKNVQGRPSQVQLNSKAAVSEYYYVVPETLSADTVFERVMEQVPAAVEAVEYLLYGLTKKHDKLVDKYQIVRTVDRNGFRFFETKISFDQINCRWLIGTVNNHIVVLSYESGIENNDLVEDEWALLTDEFNPRIYIKP